MARVINILFLTLAVRKCHKFPRKHPPEIAFCKQWCKLPDTYLECSSGKFMKFSEQLSQKNTLKWQFLQREMHFSFKNNEI